MVRFAPAAVAPLSAVVQNRATLGDLLDPRADPCRVQRAAELLPGARQRPEAAIYRDGGTHRRAFPRCLFHAVSGESLSPKRLALPFRCLDLLPGGTGRLPLFGG